MQLTSQTASELFAHGLLVFPGQPCRMPKVDLTQRRSFRDASGFVCVLGSPQASPTGHKDTAADCVWQFCSADHAKATIGRSQESVVKTELLIASLKRNAIG